MRKDLLRRLFDGPMSTAALATAIGADPSRVLDVLKALRADGIIYRIETELGAEWTITKPVDQERRALTPQKRRGEASDEQRRWNDAPFADRPQPQTRGSWWVNSSRGSEAEKAAQERMKHTPARGLGRAW